METTKIENTRTAAYDIDDIFLERWSPRSFSEKEVPEETLMALFEAAHWAPSAFNFQPWRFIVAKTEEERELFYTFINEGNKKWCIRAPVLTLILSKKMKDGKLVHSHSFDTGAAWAFLALQAVEKGLVTHPMTGFDFGKAREVLEIPEEYHIEALVAIGYQDEKEKLPEELQEREYPKGRLSLDELIIKGKFEK